MLLVRDIMENSIILELMVIYFLFFYLFEFTARQNSDSLYPLLSLGCQLGGVLLNLIDVT